LVENRPSVSAMKNIGITGVDGLLGWHFRCYLKRYADINVIPAGRTTFSTDEQLNKFVSSSDVIVHLAGMNRGDDDELEKTNIILVENIIKACKEQAHNPHIIFSSSTHCMRDTAYGRSKKEGARLFWEWANRSGGLFTNLIIPNVFGEFGKPYYNSVVSTFCYQLANGEQPEVVNDIALEVVHAQQIATEIVSAINKKKEGDISTSGVPINVSALLEKLTYFSAQYHSHIVPDLTKDIDIYLFNTFRSYLYPRYYPVSVNLHRDHRGELYEAVKSLNGGQCFISTTKPGVTRGNHFHTKKFERFMVLKGNAVIRIRKLFSSEIVDFTVSGVNPCYIDIPTLHTHNIKNIGDSELITLFWAHEIFDSDNSDTISELV